MLLENRRVLPLSEARSYTLCLSARLVLREYNKLDRRLCCSVANIGDAPVIENESSYQYRLLKLPDGMVGINVSYVFAKINCAVRLTSITHFAPVRTPIAYEPGVALAMFSRASRPSLSLLVDMVEKGLSKELTPKVLMVVG